MEWYFYVLAPILGLVTGVINTLAGSGSLLTLPFFIFAGLPATVANGTNRLGILGQSVMSTTGLRKQFQEKNPSPWILAIPAILSGMGGAWFASTRDPEVLKGIMGGVMLLMVVPVLTNTSKWLREQGEHDDYLRKPLLIFLFVVIGFYCGFIQVGSGIFMLTALVLVGGRPLRHANMLKNLINLGINVPAFIIYIIQGQIAWPIGLAMMAGQGLGGWLAAKFIESSPKANAWTRYLLIFTLLLSAGKMLWDITR
jgi:uncharacterized protein